MAHGTNGMWKKDSHCENLLKVATPELYRHNAFRVLGLPINATLREIERHRKRLEMVKKLGIDSPDQNRSCFPLDPPPDQDSIRNAIEQLRDPVQRLIEEFFWFWPLKTGLAQDKVLELLSKQNIDEVVKIWKENEKEGCCVSTHNLAVFHHLDVLDKEKDSTGEELDRCQLLWKSAFEKWQKLLEDVKFWSLLTDRIRVLNDPRLTSETARDIYSSLPKALLLINAKLAVRAAKEDKDTVERHIQLMKQSGFEERTIKDVLHEAASPIRERIKILCAPVTHKAEENPQQANQLLRSLLEKTIPWLQAIDILLPKSSVVRETLHDEIAETVRTCTIAFGNETADWNECLSLTQEILPLAASTPLRNRVKGDIEFIKKNIEIEKANAIFNTCFFCGKSAADPESMAEVSMYGNVTRKHTFTGTKTTYNKRTVPVPRCPKCKRFHEKSSNIGFVGGFITASVVACACFMAWGLEDGICAAIGLGFLGFFVGSFIVGTVSDWSLPKNIKPESNGSNFCLVEELKSQGWDVGDSP